MSNEAVARQSDFLEKLFRVQPGEWRRLLLAFSTFFLLLATWFMLRPIRGTIAANNSEILPWLYTATFSMMLVAVPVFGWLVARYPRRIFLPAVYFFFVSNILLFALIFKGDATNIWIQRGFYVWSSVFNLFVVSLFWSFMADIFRSAQAQRLFGTIMAGGAMGALLAPFLTAQLVSKIGSSGIMLIAAVSLSLTTVMVLLLKRYTVRETPPPIGGGIWEGARRVFQSRYLIYICLLMLAHNLTSTFLYNGLAILVDREIVGFDARTEFFSYVDLAVQLITFTLQFFITSRLLTYLGMPRTLIIIPIVLSGGMIILGSTLTLVLFAAVQVAQRSMNYGLIGPTKEVLFTVVDRETKYKCKNFIDTAVYRGSDVTASWLVNILLKLGLTLSNIAWIFVPLMLLWSLIAWGLGKAFLVQKARQDQAT